MLRPDHRYQARLGRSAVEAGRPGVAGKLVIGDQHEINAADAGGQVEPPGPVEDLGGTQAPRYIPRCGAAPSPRPAWRRQTGVSPGRRPPAHADDAGGARDAARLAVPGHHRAHSDTAGAARGTAASFQLLVTDIKAAPAQIAERGAEVRRPRC